jgi:hypothetical protein
MAGDVGDVVDMEFTDVRRRLEVKGGGDVLPLVVKYLDDIIPEIRCEKEVSSSKAVGRSVGRL